MATAKDVLLGMDVGEKRIGIAIGDSIARIAIPFATLAVDSNILDKLRDVINDHDVNRLIVGLPRNSAGEETKQSQDVKRYAQDVIETIGLPVIYQDESLTSVIAQERLIERKKTFTKSEIDAEAAAIILQDYLDMAYAGHFQATD